MTCRAHKTMLLSLLSSSRLFFLFTRFHDPRLPCCLVLGWERHSDKVSPNLKFSAYIWKWNKRTSRTTQNESQRKQRDYVYWISFPFIISLPTVLCTQILQKLTNGLAHANRFRHPDKIWENRDQSLSGYASYHLRGNIQTSKSQEPLKIFWNFFLSRNSERAEQVFV